MDHKGTDYLLNAQIFTQKNSKKDGKKFLLRVRLRMSFFFCTFAPDFEKKCVVGSCDSKGEMAENSL